jgi:hypothetical protein
MTCNFGMVASLPYTLTTYEAPELMYHRSRGDERMHFVVDDDGELTCIICEDIEFDDVGYSDNDFDAPPE